MSQGDQAVTFARSQIGKPYSVIPDGKNDFDCSMLTQKAWESAGVHIGRSTFLQIMDGVEIREHDLQIGDLVFPDIGHVQIYSGNRTVIEAPHSGALVQEVPMWGFWRGRRVGEAGTGAGGTAPVSTVPIISNPLANLPVVKQLNALSAHLLNAVWWKRIGLAALGLLIIGLGLAFVNRKNIEIAATTAAKTAVKAGELA